MIYGHQRLTCLDYPGKLASTIFLGGCNFKCPYCHNKGIAAKTAEPDVTDEEVIEFLKGRVHILDGVVVSGGEPCIHGERLRELLRTVKAMGYSVKLDTNGYLPDVLEDLIERNLVDYVAMDLKNQINKYPETAGIERFNKYRIAESLDVLISGHVDYEIRTTVVKEFHNDDDFKAMGCLIAGAKRYYLQPYVGDEFHAPSEKKLKEYAMIMEQFVDEVYIRGI